MATALVLTAKPSVAAVLVEITGAPAGAVTITRTDINGAKTVRLQDGQAPIGGSLTIFDYEAALNDVVAYEVLDSALTVTSGSVTTSVAKPFITAVALPHLRHEIYGVTDYDSDQENGSTVHWVIGRTDPVVVSGEMRKRAGSLTLFVSTYADVKTVESVAAPGEVLLFRQPDFGGMDMYLLATRVSARPGDRTATGRHWEVTINYNEVGFPSSPVRSSTWNFNEIKALGTFNAIKTQFPTFNDLVAGP